MRWKLVVLLAVAACLLIDFFPRFGPPEFRYTGSDPSVHVWNLGWPLATAIYDRRTGLQVGPFAYLLLPAEALGLLALAIGAWFYRTSRRGPTDQRGLFSDARPTGT